MLTQLFLLDLIAQFSPFIVQHIESNERSRDGKFLFSPSREDFCDRLYMCIPIHVFSSCLLLLAWCSLYLLLCICVYLAVRLFRACFNLLSHTHTDVIVAFTYKWFCVLVWLLLYSLHVNSSKTLYNRSLPNILGCLP